jgi:hypothetical protein
VFGGLDPGVAVKSPTVVLDELIAEMGDGSGPVERVIADWSGPEVSMAAAIQQGAPRVLAMSVIEELGRTWGATGDPSWVEGVVPGRDNDDDTELDYMFALYRRPRVYAYARLRGDTREPPSHVRMVLGVVRKLADHGD